MEKNTNESTKLTDELLHQVKGGPAYIKIGDIKGEVTSSSSQSKTLRGIRR